MKIYAKTSHLRENSYRTWVRIYRDIAIPYLLSADPRANLYSWAHASWSKEWEAVPSREVKRVELLDRKIWRPMTADEILAVVVEAKLARKP